jgi:hypothetical protein
MKKKPLHYLLWILALVFLVGFAQSRGATPQDLIRPAAWLSVLIWLAALVGLLSRRDVEIHDKLTWVVTILLLNGIGGALYFIFGPKRGSSAGESEPVDPDAIPINPEGKSWNPILGENRMADGEGLNPRNTETTEQNDGQLSSESALSDEVSS